MNDIEHIKEIIVSVKPDDTETLDEIDARVWCVYTPETDYAGVYRDQDASMYGELVKRHCYYDKGSSYGRAIEKPILGLFDFEPSRSIDAQKALEVEGWSLFVSQYEQGSFYVSLSKSGIILLDTPYLPTEALARLYCWLCVKQWEDEDGS